MAVLSDWKSCYTTSGQRFISFYLTYSQTNAQDFDALAAELPNLQQCFEQAVRQEEDSQVIRFWDYASDFLWFRGYWQLYSMWGECTLEAVRHLNRYDKEAWLLSELGWLQMERGELGTARKLFNQSRSIFERAGDARGTCVILRYLGVVCFRMEEIAQAEVFLENALRVAEQNGYQGMIAEIKNLRGSVAREYGDFEKAQRAYAEAREGFEAVGDLVRLTGVLRNMGKLALEIGDLISARSVFEEAVEVCQKIGRKDMLYGCQLGLAEVEWQASNGDLAGQLALLARNGFSELGMRRDVDRVDEFLRSFERQNA